MRGRDLFRLWQFPVLTAILLFVIWFFSPTNLPVVIWKTALVTLALWLGYWADRLIFHYARPDRVAADFIAWAMMRRAIIIAACVLAMAQGL